MRAVLHRDIDMTAVEGALDMIATVLPQATREA